MGRGERTGSKNNSKGHVWKRNVKSDDSDEDYMLEEDEPADQSDELESLVGDASDEESLGSFVEEEEEESGRKGVRHKSRKRSTGRTENGITISKRQKRIASDEEDDEDYDFEEEDNDANVQKSRKRSIGRRKNGIKSSKQRKRIASDDEDYAYEEEEEDNDADVEKSRKRSIGRRETGIKSSNKAERIVSDEEDDEDYDFEEDNDADVQKSHKRSIGRRKNGIKSSKQRKRIASDDEDYAFEEEEDNDADVEKSRKRSIGRRENGIKSSNKAEKSRKSSKKGERIASDEDDEDYDYEEGNDVDVQKSRKRSIWRRKNGRRENGIKSAKKGERITSDEEDDEDYDYEEDIDADVQKSRKRSRGRRENRIKSSKKGERIASDEDDEDYDYEGEEDNDADVEKSCKRSMGRRKNGIGSSKRRETVTAYDEEDEDDCDYEEEHDDTDVEKSCNRSIGQRKHGIKSSKKGEMVAAYDEEEKDNYDYEKDNDADVDSIGGGGDDVDYDDEDDYEEDDDDEFNLEELDSLDEEEEHPSPKGKKDRGHLKKKSSVRSRKIRTGANLKRHGSNRSSMPTSGRSRNSTKKVLSSRGRCKRRSIHRKKKAKPCSDSDFVSSEPSDFAFTTSEEEREQVREANEFCRRSSTNLRSSKQDKQDAAAKQLKNLPKRKGKEKVEDIKSDVGKQVCGICLTEEGKNTTRGTLDCCSHFFCFACIMEWSKVESRCPLCKQRFSTISKPARSATRIDTRNEVIHVPERDQVYQPSEEELRNYLDPYENVMCTECHEGGDDALMLLCDICDSPAHTYCVGLGREVPEGNWYCEGCRPSALGSTSSQAQDLTPDQRLHSSSLSEPSPFENMAEIDLNITIPETPMTPVNGFLISPIQPSGGSFQQAPPPVSGVGVSTLSGRRMVHRLQYFMSSNGLSPRSSRVDRASQPSYLETGTADAETSYNAESFDRSQIQSSTAQNRECFPRRPSLLRGQALQAPPPAADSPASDCVQSGVVGGINLERLSVPGHEWLQPCTSRLNMASETSTSLSHNMDVDQNTVKQQIIPSVKIQLKNILSRDMNLGYETLKQIIRSSTHTILSACGFEHSSREVHEVRPPICLHYEALVGPQMSLIKGCCQACFDSFVRDVVRMITDIKAKPPEQLSFRNY